MGEIEDLGREWDRHFRLAVLIALSVAPGSSLNDSILHTHVTGSRLRFKCRREQVRMTMRWLGREGLVMLESDADDYIVATLTEAGGEVVSGACRHPQVRSPGL